METKATVEGRTRIDTKSLVITALFVALSFAGANIKILGSIAFDSLPGFVGALLLGPAFGAAIGFLGHMFTSLTSGFPLSVPLHIVIGLSMALTMLGFGLSYRTLQSKLSRSANVAITGAVGVALNGPVSLALSMGALALMAGKDAAIGLLALFPALMVASVANVVASLLIFKPLESVWARIR